MEIFRLIADSNHYEAAWPVDSESFSLFGTFDGRSQLPWTSPLMRPFGSEDQRGVESPLPQGDLASPLSRVPVFSSRAVDVLRPMLEAAGEILPLDCPGRRYFAFNVTRVVDALDESRSILKRFSDGGVMRIVEPHFKREALEDAHIFKVSQLRTVVFVDDAFVERVLNAELKGFLFEKVWTSS
jgi:hypothetical protein